MKKLTAQEADEIVYDKEETAFEKAMDAIYRTAKYHGRKHMYLFGDANLNERIVALGYKSERLRDGMYYITWGIDKRFVTSPAE